MQSFLGLFLASLKGGYCLASVKKAVMERRPIVLLFERLRRSGAEEQRVIFGAAVSTSVLISVVVVVIAVVVGMACEISSASVGMLIFAVVEWEAKRARRRAAHCRLRAFPIKAGRLLIVRCFLLFTIPNVKRRPYDRTIMIVVLPPPIISIPARTMANTR